jgi:hypothetical protein
MAERFKAAVLKTASPERRRGFESLSLRQNLLHKFWRDITKSLVAFGRSAFLHLANFFTRKDKANNEEFTITTVAPAGKSA